MKSIRARIERIEAALRWQSPPDRPPVIHLFVPSIEKPPPEWEPIWSPEQGMWLYDIYKRRLAREASTVRQQNEQPASDASG